jgi:hypothetical protein
MESRQRPPDLKIMGLKIWVHHRQFPKAEDYWDGNWINVTALCEAQGASVRIDGNIIHLSEIERFISGADKVYQNLKGKAELSCMEPELSVGLEAKSLGQIEMVVDMTPDHLSQSHRFIFEVDQSYLPKLISDSRLILKKYPIKGSP